MSVLKQNISLSNFSNYRIGGPAQYLSEIFSEEDLINGIKEFRNIKQGGKIFILGGGTNLLIPDEGIEGLVILNKLKGIFIEAEGLRVESGVLISDLLNYCIENGLSGLEWAGGLPGTVGGGVRGNAGAFGGEVKDSVEKVLSINLETFEEQVRNTSDLKFGYRDSVFKSGEGRDDFIVEVYFKLIPGESSEIKNKAQERIDYRWERHPMELPNIGSTFKNIPVKEVPQDILDQFKNSIKNDPFPILPVAKILSVAGLKGKRIGDAQVSEKHPNFIVNLGHAKASDVLSLIEIVKKEIKDKYGLSLEEEIIIL